MSDSRNFYFSLLGRFFENKLVLQVTETGKNQEIEPGHIFYDINALGQLVSEGDLHMAGYPIVELMVEENKQ